MIFMFWSANLKEKKFGNLKKFVKVKNYEKLENLPNLDNLGSSENLENLANLKICNFCFSHKQKKDLGIDRHLTEFYGFCCF